MKSGRLSERINYNNINEANKEQRRSDYWLVEIDPAPGIYFPGNDLIQIRTGSFAPGISDDPTIMTKQIRTFTIHQAGKPGETNGQMTLTLTDRVDQTIAYWIDQWKQACGSRDELSGIEKAQYTCPTIRAMYFDINEQKIRDITFFNCIIATGGLPEDGAGEVGVEDDISLNIAYEHFKRNFLNEPLA